MAHGGPQRRDHCRVDDLSASKPFACSSASKRANKRSAGPARGGAKSSWRWGVKRHANGTPDRHLIGTLSALVQACPGSEREGPRAERSDRHESDGAQRGRACLPTGASRGGTASQARCLKRQLSLPVSIISQ